MGTQRAVVLLSGGIDSAVTLAEAQQRGHTCHTITFNYGQRHAVEVNAAQRVAIRAKVADHRIIDIGLAQFGGSALTDPTIPVPTGQLGAPATYVPARNTIFLSYALAYAETIGAHNIFIGCNRDDWDGYPDCRPEYLDAFEIMAGYATTTGHQLLIHAPLIGLRKTNIIRRGAELGIDYTHTWSCYDPQDSRPCGRCDACLLRAKAFAEAGLTDPAVA